MHDTFQIDLLLFTHLVIKVDTYEYRVTDIAHGLIEILGVSDLTLVLATNPISSQDQDQSGCGHDLL